MTWQARMILKGWKRDGDGWIYRRRYLGMALTIPAFMARVWESLDRVPEIVA